MLVLYRLWSRQTMWKLEKKNDVGKRPDPSIVLGTDTDSSFNLYCKDLHLRSANRNVDCKQKPLENDTISFKEKVEKPFRITLEHIVLKQRPCSGITLSTSNCQFMYPWDLVWGFQYEFESAASSLHIQRNELCSSVVLGAQMNKKGIC